MKTIFDKLKSPSIYKNIDISTKLELDMTVYKEPGFISFSERHKPVSFSDLVFADSSTEEIFKLYANRKLYNNVIMHGTYGTAKSTTARIIVHERQRVCDINNVQIERYTGKELNGNLHLIENSFDLLINTNIEDEEPYVIIDEVDELSIDNQLELRDFIDRNDPGRLIMTTNHLSKIDGGLRDRCEGFELLNPNAQSWMKRVDDILEKEGVKAPKKVIINLLQTAPSAREILRGLERLVVVHKLQIQAKMGR